MLRINKAEEQAVRLVMRLAAHGDQLTLADLAAQEHLPEPTVAKLLGQLRRGGVVDAIRGRNGGYVLAVGPAEISAAQVLRALGGDPAPEHACDNETSDGTACPRIDDCGLRAVWRHLQERVTDLLERTSIADLLQVERQVGGQLQQIWPADASSLDDDTSRTPADLGPDYPGQTISEGA